MLINCCRKLNSIKAVNRFLKSILIKTTICRLKSILINCCRKSILNKTKNRRFDRKSVLIDYNRKRATNRRCC